MAYNWCQKVALSREGANAPLNGTYSKRGGGGAHETKLNELLCTASENVQFLYVSCACPSVSGCPRRWGQLLLEWLLRFVLWKVAPTILLQGALNTHSSYSRLQYITESQRGDPALENEYSKEEESFSCIMLGAA